MPPIALIVTDTQHSRLGHPSRLGDVLGDANVLTHTLRRAVAVHGIRRVVIVHPPGQAPAVQTLLQGASPGKPVALFEAPALDAVGTAADARWQAARRWAPTAWRGGLGGATIFDELLPASSLAAAMTAHDANAAVVVRAEWCLFDPGLASNQLAKHLEQPEAYKLTFSQAPPGLSCLVAHRELIDQLAQSHAGVGSGLAYQPARPQLDAISRELNRPVPASVRDMNRRFVYDTPRAVELVQAVAQRLGSTLPEADATAVTDAARAVEADCPDARWQRLPQQVTLELTPRRAVSGPITPHHHVRFERGDMAVDTARRVIEQLADQSAVGDIALRLGGLGDALLHPQWEAIVQAAAQAGVMSVGLDTDLLCDRDTLDRLLASPIDLLTVRLNADTAATYQQVMGADRFKQVADNLQYLFDHRRTAWREGRSPLCWIVPRLIKTRETLADLESFFDRWMHVEGHALIEPAQAGCGLMPEQSPIPMTPPARRPCRQLGSRMTILSDGQMALCDQDWLGQAAAGQVQHARLLELWQRLAKPARQHAEGKTANLTLCAKCHEWHRP